MTRPRLWVASELYWPDDTSTAYFLTHIAEGLAEHYDVHIITGAGAMALCEQRNGTTVHRLHATRYDKNRMLLRLVNLLTFTMAALGFALLKLRRGDTVLVVTNPPTLPAALALAGWLRGARLCLLVHDVYPEVLSVAGVLSRQSLAYRLLDGASKILLRRFDRIVVLGRDMRDIIAGKLGGDSTRINIIPNWGDVDEIYPLPPGRNTLRRELYLGGKFVVQFSGNIGRTHDLDSVLATAYALRDRTDIRFLLVGQGGKLRGATDELSRRGLHNVILLPRQPRARLAEMLGCSDLTIIAFVEEMRGLSVPSRMYNVMAAGVPIAALADPASELALTVVENNAGWSLPGGDTEALTKLVSNLAADVERGEARVRGEKGRQAVTRDFTLPMVVNQFLALLDGLTMNKAIDTITPFETHRLRANRSGKK
jgi:colanic acid biosynthesis glycosyl transferase WcaI